LDKEKSVITASLMVANLTEEPPKATRPNMANARKVGKHPTRKRTILGNERSIVSLRVP